MFGLIFEYKRIMRKQFDQIISLGSFCSVAMELEKIGLRSASYPFDWLISESFESVIGLIKSNFDSFLDPCDISVENKPHVYYKESLKIHFHHDFNASDALDVQIPQVEKKYQRRIRRFYSDICKPTLFVRYCIRPEDEVFVRENEDAILRYLQSFNPENRILYVLSSDTDNYFSADDSAGSWKCYIRHPENDFVRNWIAAVPGLKRFLYSVTSFSKGQILKNILICYEKKVLKRLRRGVPKGAAVLAFALSMAICAAAQTGTWSGKIDVNGTLLPVVFHLDADSLSMDSPDQGIRGIPIEVDRQGSGTVVIRIPSIGATFNGIWMMKKIAGSFNQFGASFPLTLSQGVEKLNRPQTPVGPFPYMQEEVSFVNEDATLKGILTLPEGYTRSTPALVMVTGSGLQNRDEELFEHKPFAVIADALARCGIATLRYDDRGFGESTGDVANCTTEDLMHDALSGIRLLRERFENVGVIGHSEGGSIALMLASRGDADFIVSLAGMVVSGAETLVWQNRVILAESGFSDRDVDTYCNMLSKAFDAAVNGKPFPSAEKTDLPDALKKNFSALLGQLQSPYLRYFLAMDMRGLLGDIECPVLALNGTMDTQVDYVSNLEALRTALGANPRNRIEAVEGRNHLFQHCTTGSVSEYKLIEETFSPDVIQTIISFILSN